jgi:hypothetical protein
MGRPHSTPLHDPTKRQMMLMIEESRTQSGPTVISGSRASWQLFCRFINAIEAIKEVAKGAYVPRDCILAAKRHLGGMHGSV